MPTYVTLVKLGAEGAKSMGELRKGYEESTKMAEQMGIKSIGAYGVLGPYDMMYIYEAPDEKVTAGTCMAIVSKWGGETETWTVIPMEEFIKLAERVKS